MGSGAAAPTRLFNNQVNPYWGMVDKNVPQTAVYIHGQSLPPGLEGGVPTWIPIEFPAVAAFDTQDSVIHLPADFTLLCALGYSSQAASFAVQIYDSIARRWIVDKLVDARLIGGLTGFALIERVPHTFEGEQPEAFVRVANQAAATADIMLALYGVVGGAKD